MDIEHIKNLNKAFMEMFDNKIQCVIKVEDEGNAYKYIGIIEDNTDYMSQYDVDVEYQDRKETEEPTIDYILAYHNDGEKVFYDENDVEFDFDMEDDEAFDAEYEDAVNSEDNTVIPDKDMIN